MGNSGGKTFAPVPRHRARRKQRPAGNKERRVITKPRLNQIKPKKAETRKNGKGKEVGLEKETQEEGTVHHIVNGLGNELHNGTHVTETVVTSRIEKKKNGEKRYALLRKAGKGAGVNLSQKRKKG